MGTITLIMIVGYIAFTLAVVVRMAQRWDGLWNRELLSDLDNASKELEALTLTKDRLLKDIKGLDFDFQIGHLTDADYKQLRRKLERRAISLMKQIDGIHGDTDYDALINDGLRTRFGIEFDGDDIVPVTSPSLAGDLSPSSVKVVTPCHSCGWSMGDDALFCSECGVSLAEAPSEPSDATLCKGCGEILDEDSKFCKHCGLPAVFEGVAQKEPNASTEEMEVV